jgi:regulator of cell morphogenesis and NO signaling
MDQQKTLGQLATENPAAVRVFERLGLDYCCGGNQTLEQACGAAGVAVEEIETWLQAIPPEKVVKNWQDEPLFALIAHIQDTHHAYVRETVARLRPLFDKVCQAHAANHPELRVQNDVFNGLAEELSSHLMKEEMVLFPYIIRLEEASLEQRPAIPAPFGTVQNPVSMMMREHDSAGEALRELRQAASGYALPPDACASYRELYRTLLEFEADLHQHIHLENNILFPRAIALEAAISER